MKIVRAGLVEPRKFELIEDDIEPAPDEAIVIGGDLRAADTAGADAGPTGADVVVEFTGVPGGLELSAKLVQRAGKQASTPYLHPCTRLRGCDHRIEHPLISQAIGEVGHHLGVVGDGADEVAHVGTVIMF